MAIKLDKEALKQRARVFAETWAHHAAVSAYRKTISAKPVNPTKTVFIDQGQIHMPAPFHAIYGRLEREYSQELSYIGLGENEGVGWQGYRERCIKAATALADAKTIFLTDESSFIDSLPIRKETQVVSLKQRFGEPPYDEVRIICETLPDAKLVNKPSVEERMQSAMHENNTAAKLYSSLSYDLDLSIIVPAHNAMPELTRALESIAEQDYDLSRIELIVIDDGSIDNTWDEITRFSTLHPGLVHPIKLDKPSGSPAHPRNVGLNVARGEYVFFLDADDWLGSEAVRRMLGHAIDWNSDVLYVKMVGENDRHVPQSMFIGNLPEADVCYSKIMWSLGPLKLFRRSLIEDYGLRFFENGMPEDLHITVPALGEAKIVSVAADYDYYHCSWRAGGNNAFRSIWDDFDSNMHSYRPLMKYIRYRFTSRERQAVLMRRLFSQDVAFMVNEAMKQHPEERIRREREIRELFGEDYTSNIRAHLTCDVYEILDGVFCES